MNDRLRDLEERMARIERQVFLPTGSPAPYPPGAQDRPAPPADPARHPGPAAPDGPSGTGQRPSGSQRPGNGALPLSGGLTEDEVIGTWFPRVGALALVLGAAFGFKYAVDQGFIGPAIRVLIGFVVGAALLVVGELTRQRNWKGFAQAVSGGGLGILYLTTWASWHLYGYLSAEVASALLLGISGLGIAVSLRHDGEALAVVAVLGAFWSPFATDLYLTSAETTYAYAFSIDIGVVLLALVRPWRHLTKVAFVSTWFILGAVDGPDVSALVAASVAFVLFGSATYLAGLLRRREATGSDLVALTSNALVYYLFVMIRIEDVDPTGARFTLGLAVLHAIVGLAMHRTDADRTLGDATLAIGLFFAALWIPLDFGLEVSPLLWALGAAGAIAIAARTNGTLSSVTVYALLGISIYVHLANGSVDVPFAFTTALSRVTFGAQIVTLFLLSRLDAGGSPRPGSLNVAGVTGAHVLGIAWLTLELATHFHTDALDPRNGDFPFALSAAWALYAGGLLMAGVGLRSRTCRVLSVALFGLTLVKMTITDLWLLPELQRLVGFAGIGTLLIVCSMTYHRFKAFLLIDTPRADGNL